MTEAYAVSERYKDVTQTKADGITYTPRELANFVASRIVENAKHTTRVPLRILDPAVGHGELLIALLDKLSCPVEVYGFETDPEALAEARTRLTGAFPMVELHLQLGSFLEHVLDDHSAGLFGNAAPYDLIIANPPYVRTQVMGADRARLLASQYGLSGRVDLYHAFLLGKYTIY